MSRRRTYLFGLAVAAAAVVLGWGVFADAEAQTITCSCGASIWGPASFDYHRTHEGASWHWPPSLGRHCHERRVGVPCWGSSCLAYQRNRVPWEGKINAALLRRLRDEARDAARVPGSSPQGWSVSRVDPMGILAVFKPLRVRRGFVLRGYEFRLGGNSSGLVLAMPKEAPYPGQNRAWGQADDLAVARKPASALDEVMEAIEGDGTTWSYVCASLLKRELEEFGARWHGYNWSTHTILSENPWRGRERVRWRMPFGEVDGPSEYLDAWKWLEPEPAGWSPRVRMASDSVTVTFYTYSPLGEEGIYRHADLYRRGSYVFQRERKKIASGPRYFVF